MPKSQIYEELKRLLVNPKITFEKGLIATSNDTTLGYVSDMNNMEIEGGVISNRKGSFCLNDPDEEYAWRVLTEATLCGVSMLIGVTMKREVYVMVEEIHQKLMPIYKKGIDPFRIGSDGDLSFKLQFTRGSKFFIENMESEQYFYIANEFGDIFRINKDSYIQFFEEYDYDSRPDSYRVEADAVRGLGSYTDFFSKNIGVYLDVVDVSFKENFSIIPIGHDNEFTVPVRGNIRYAPINNAGIIGRFSDTIAITDYKRLVFSPFNGEILQSKDGDLRVNAGFREYTFTPQPES